MCDEVVEEVVLFVCAIRIGMLDTSICRPSSGGTGSHQHSTHWSCHCLPPHCRMMKKQNQQKQAEGTEEDPRQAVEEEVEKEEQYRMQREKDVNGLQVIAMYMY